MSIRSRRRSSGGLEDLRGRTALHPDPEDRRKAFVHAWAEVFAFEGERNVARERRSAVLAVRLRLRRGTGIPRFSSMARRRWACRKSPKEHGNIGWISEGRAKANETATLTVDLGESVEMDAVRLLPAKRPTSDLPSGFGFPRKLAISVSETGETGERGKWAVVAERAIPESRAQSGGRFPSSPAAGGLLESRPPSCGKRSRATRRFSR